MRKLNYGMYLALAALAFLVLNDLGLDITHGKWESYVSYIGYILVGFGVFSNPKEGKWFTDDKDKW